MNPTSLPPSPDAPRPWTSNELLGWDGKPSLPDRPEGLDRSCHCGGNCPCVECRGMCRDAAARSASPDPDLDGNSASVIYRSGWEAGHNAGLSDAALAQPEPLDVERLARAITDHGHDGDEALAACAPFVAAEYARLRSDQEPA